MNKLQELIDEFCPNGVCFQELGKLVLKVDNIKWKNHKEHEYLYIDLTSVDRETHTIIDTQTINYITAPSRAQQIVKTGDVLLGATRPMLKRYCMVDTQYDESICSTGFCVLRANNALILPGYLNHIISSTAFFDHVEKFQQGTNYPAISDADVKRYKVPLPPLPVQQEIVNILDAFTELTTELVDKLNVEIIARKKQYAYYRDLLLSFDYSSTPPPIPWKCPKNQIFLGSFAKFTYGYTDKAQTVGDARFIRITDIDENGCLNVQDAKYIHLSEESRAYLLKRGDLLVARTGATYGKTLYIPNDAPAVYASFLIKITLDENVMTNRFYWHFAQSSLYWEQANRLVSTGGQPQFNAGAIRRILVPVPPLDEQKRIVAILDYFDALCNDLTAGLPAEIEARRKQYS